MLHVMKRRKVDATPASTSAAPLQAYERSMHHQQHLYNNSSSPPMSSYAQLQQQLHLQQQQQQQRLAVSGRYASERRSNSPYPAADERAMHMRAQQQQQRASQGHLRTTNGVALQRSNGGSSSTQYPATVGSRVQQDRYPSAEAGSKRQYEQYQQQQQQQQPTQYQTQQLRSYPHPSVMMPRTTSSASTSSPNSSPFSIASSISTTCSPVVTMATSGSSTTTTTTTTTSRAMGTESPLSLPGISSMLRMPSSNPNAGDTIADGSLSVHSPMVMPGSSSSSNMFSLPYKWTPEMASISPMKVNAGVAPPALSLSSSSQQDTSSSRSTVSGYSYNRSRPAAAKKPSAATVIPEPTATADRSVLGSRVGRQSFDSNDGKSYSVTSSSSNTPRSQISSNGDEQVHNRVGLTSSSTTGSGTTTAATTTSASEERIANPNKNSRYLREMDRREILQRIEQGEKQATLAKEYQVSRAAICNLNKHREDVMLRKDENPLAKHPKKPRPKSLKVKVRSSKAANRKLPSPRLNGSSGGGKGSNTHEVKSRAAALLLTSLRNKNTSMSEFRRSSDRLVRLVLEEALALVPIKAVEVFLSDSVRADGVGWEHPPCAISMENASQQHSTEGGSPLLDLFRAIEPDQPTARASIIEQLDHHYHEVEDVTQSKTQQVNLVDTHLLPSSLKYHNVFVFDVSATSADAICAVVQKLQERGAVEAMICLVVLFINSEIIASVHKKYPSVKIVAAQIDPSGKTPAPAATTSAPGVDGADGGADAAANGEKSSAGGARPPCCLEFVLSRFRQLYGGSYTTNNKGLGSHLIN